MQNGKRASGMKFTSSEFCLPFAKTMNRPVADVNGRQPTLLTAFLILIVFPSLHDHNYQHVCSFPGFCVLRDDNRSV